jgi:hypothetical protein
MGECAVDVMPIADNDGDGRTTEFVLVLSCYPMARAKSVLVGVSKRNPHLHVFGTVEQPDKPLILGSPLDWELVKQGSTSLLVQACADHMSDVQVTRIVRLDAAGFHDLGIHIRQCAGTTAISPKASCDNCDQCYATCNATFLTCTEGTGTWSYGCGILARARVRPLSLREVEPAPVLRALRSRGRWIAPV